MVNIGVSWNRKTNIFFISPQKTKVYQNCYIDVLTTSLLPEFRRHYPGNDLKEAIKNKWKVTIETVRKSIAEWK